MSELLVRFRKIILIGIVLISAGLISAQTEDISSDSIDSMVFGTDTTLVVPTEFDNSLDYLLRSWIMQNMDSTDCFSDSLVVEVNDSIYKQRLETMPCVMEMPYNKTVRSYIELYTVRKRKQVEYLMGMSDYYFPIFEEILGANNLPLELKYLPIIESALNTTIVSRMGAAGLWQFMIATGRMYGLEINSLVDERLDPIKATHAAAHFLKDLYSIYGDWHLVIAAYNCGPGNVNKAIRRAGGKRDYWAIYPYLPAETRGYVPIFIAANYAMNYGAHHNICKAQVQMPIIVDTIVVRERVHLEQIARVLDMPLDQIRLLNAQYRKDIIPGNIKPYAVCLPLVYANQFIGNYDDIVNYKADSLINNRRSEIEISQKSPVSWSGSGNVIYHKVTSGQTLSHIAQKYKVSVKNIMRWNGLRSTNIRAGQKLKIHK